MSTITNTAVESLNRILKKHEEDRAEMATLLKKTHGSFAALRIDHSKLKADHTRTVLELERAKAEIKRLEKENADRGNDIMMLTSTISLFDESVSQSDGILLESIRHMARDFRIDEPAAQNPVVEALASAQLPPLVPALVEDEADMVDEASVEGSETSANGAESPLFVADVAAPGAAGSDFLTDADEQRLEQLLSENVEFAIQKV